MSYTPRSLFRLLEDIDGNRLLLPHIQRPFVWQPHQTERLFDSLMRDYPIQTSLFRSTRTRPKQHDERLRAGTSRCSTGGQVCGHVRRYSDALLIARLKALDPETYRENWKGELTGPASGPLQAAAAQGDLSRLSDEQLKL